MWSPEDDYPRRVRRTVEPPRYLMPGAFTILPHGKQMPLPDPPSSANTEHRLTPTSRNHRNASFAIIADLESNHGSRSPSPTGRVSPFRGRGFNPAGSRHASPLPSPPPAEDRGARETRQSIKRSKIPTLSRQNSSVTSSSAEQPTNLTKQFSQSLVNISPRNVANKPPPSPSKHTTFRLPKSRPTGFKKLSPIIGSSPEPSPETQQQSSPSKIPRSKSQPASMRSGSRDASRSASKTSSREASPTKPNAKASYKNIKAKVNSYSALKPKVPPKPQVPKTNNDSVVDVKPLINSVVTTTNKNNSNTNNIKNSSNSEVNGGTKSKDQPKEEEQELIVENIEDVASTVGKQSETHPKTTEVISHSTSAVVSSTTTAVTQPLKIDAKIDAKFDVCSSDDSDKVYIPDARALSATSVSTAMNRMNDTVLDTKTLMKDTNITSKFTPMVVSTSNDQNENMPKPVKSVTIAETNGKRNVISPERTVVSLTDALPKSANERIKEARTMVATDVQPIRITVKEKPSNVDVQSGNVRLPVSATNGIAERPGLPPPQPPPPEETPPTPEPPKGICGRFLGCCRKKPKTNNVKKSEIKEATANPKPKKNYWCCGRNKQKDEENAKEEKRIDSGTSLIEEDQETKSKWWKKINCCNRNKVADRLPKEQRKNSWAETREDNSTVTTAGKKSVKDVCRNFFRTIFCVNYCSKKKKKEEEANMRRASMMSKKKSLTPPTVQEDVKPKLDAGLVEHTSLMKGAIPVLPVPLAWLCLILNVFLPGIGTIVSGFLCVCMGKPRFSTKDGMRQRLGACIINFFIGAGQLFTVLFCLVGWGWSIWWGVIMLKTARKYRKIRRAEKAMEEESLPPTIDLTKDPERGS